MHNLWDVKCTRRRAGFTLIEVLAALAIIVVLTLALILTVKGQVEQAHKKDENLMITTVNAQLEVQSTDMESGELAGLNSTKELLDSGLISSQQYSQLNKDHASVKIEDGHPVVTAGKD
ncbi:type II secretion system protein [Lacticaseibacillus zhaodongensis]|uniref:type II secretion system protein n=1 Tax=Lacticaseibacillus zhaodongensis TaxID=2668065 RepID=UPI0012D3091F|nr:type II secretion system protein [Lacticaseibacillus zhaodongensis]